MASGRATQHDTSSSSPRNFMPRTPAASRPMARTSASEMRRVWPERDTRKMSSRPLVGTTATNSSPSFRRTAIKPAFREES